ncbi:flhB HrpN YscU SpaS family protein, partial [Vibrio parahaemolyticus V-223/04]
MRFFWRLR